MSEKKTNLVKTYKITNKKHYQSIGTNIDNKTFIIPPKGQSKIFKAKVIPGDIRQLINDKVVELVEITKK